MRRRFTPGRINFSSRRGSSITSVLASATSGLAVFVIFRATADLASLNILGCWALLQGIFVATRLADSGAGANITRRIAAARNCGEPYKLSRFFSAGLLLSVVPVCLLSLATAVPAYLYVQSRCADSLTPATLNSLTMCAAATTGMASLASLTLALVEGCGLVSPRNIITILANIVVLILAFPAISCFGIIGTALLYIVMYAAQIIGSLAVLSRRPKHPEAMHQMPIRQLLASLWKENLTLTGIGVVRISFEPVTKGFMSWVAGPSSIAFLDLAIKVTGQVRVLQQAWMQPVFVRAARSGIAVSRDLAREFLGLESLVLRSSSILIGVQVVAGPGLSYLALGRFNPEFCSYYLMLALANHFNATGLPGYFFQLSSGDLGPLLKIQLRMAALNLTIGIVGLALSSRTMILSAYSLAFLYGGVASGQLLRQVRSETAEDPTGNGTSGVPRILGTASVLGLALTVVLFLIAPLLTLLQVLVISIILSAAVVSSSLPYVFPLRANSLSSLVKAPASHKG
jgi:hypothetical protein